MTEGDTLPYVHKKIVKQASGVILEEKSLTVQGRDLKECKEIFKKIWSEKDE